MGTAGERKTKREKRREQRAEEDETWDNDGSLSGKLNLSRCYWEENGKEEEQRSGGRGETESKINSTHLFGLGQIMTGGGGGPQPS